ncbi:MAG TPA: DUF4139 domain-containing protein [Planctomycetota bacterium]|jgi:regulator of replication initiation timing
MNPTRVILSLLMVAFTAVAAEAPANPPPEIKRIELYKHGTGYFERQGKVKGNANVSLPFKTEQMKDLLTSFFVLDLNGGHVNAVIYDAKEPLSKQLEGILITVPENSALVAFLTQMKGASITARIAGEKITGRIMGVEPVTERTDDGKVLHQSYKLVLLSDAGAIRPIDLFSIAEMTLGDAALQQDLERLLKLTLDAKYTERKTVTIQAQGDGERELRIGYLIEQPIWKASYRVLFDKDAKADALLQGWAIAENNTEEDWKDVEIAFVAGNPLSYSMDLYSSYYPERPQVPIPGLTGLAVNWGAAPEVEALEKLQQAAQGADKALELKDAKADDRRAYSRGLKRAELGGPGAPAAAGALAGKQVMELAEKSMSAMATGTKVGELFRYQGKEKVSIGRGKAAMVPILSQKVKGERVVYYKAAFSPRPVDAYTLKNDTTLTLEAGPMTFFEQDSSLGNGILSHVLVTGAKEIIPYALDAAISVTPEVKAQSEPAYRGQVANGYLTLTSVENLTSTWKIANKGAEDKTVLFDQPISPDYKLIEPAKPEEEVEGHYRFRVAAKHGETKEFKVLARRDVASRVALANVSEEQIRLYAQEKFFSAKAKQFFGELAALQAQRADIVRQIRDMSGQVQRLSEEQKRLRDNLNTLRQTAKEEELRAKWVKTLSDTEDTLSGLRTKTDEANAKQRTLDEQLAKKVLEYQGE